MNNNVLEHKFVYQNSTTGKVSSTPLTTRQLVQLLCPIHHHSSTAAAAIMTPDTLVLGISDTYEYDKSGWKACKHVPVLKEACASWYYLEHQQQEQEGPVSCRQLHDLLSNQTITKNTTLVWSSHLLTEWKSISDLPDLCAALEAFETKLVAAPFAAAPTRFTTTTLHADTNNNDNDTTNDNDDAKIQKELQAFLSSTANLGPQHQHPDDNDGEQGYVSDGGTSYVKDVSITGNWIPANLVQTNNNDHGTKPKRPFQQQQQQQSQTTTTKKKKQRSSRLKFSQKHAKCWIYVQGLPRDTTVEELHAFCSKAGILELHPETQLPKIKLYRNNDNNGDMIKGDASVCYARPESVDLAIQLLDDAPFRPHVSVTDFKVKIQKAKFEQHGAGVYEKKQISQAKRKVAKLAALQAIGWDEGGDNGRITGGIKGLRIVVIKHLFTLQELLSDGSSNEDAILQQVERDVYHTCSEFGTVEKITIFSKHVDGVVIVKFKEPNAASTAVQEYNGKLRNGRKLECIFWDGVTDYTVRNEEQEQEEAIQRQEAFGEWLDSQELPPEFQLLTE
jgi:hypothetical protein